MLNAILRASLHHARLVAALLVAIMALGVYAMPGEKTDIFPPTAPTQMSIVTDAPGLVSEQVEQLVTRPIEYAVIGAAGVAAVHSDSAQGISVVSLTLEAGADPYRTRQALSENLDAADAGLPDGTGPAHLTPLPSSAGELLDLGFIAPKLSSMDLRDIVQWEVRPRLLSTPGVATVTLFGGDVRRIEVRARSGDLADSDLGYADVIDAVRRATSVRGAGFIDTPQQRILIDPHGQALTAEDVAAGQIHVTGGAPVRIGDVSDVAQATAPAHSDALIGGKPGVLVTIASQLGTDTVETTRRIEAALDLLKASLAARGVTVATGLDRPAAFIDQAIHRLLVDLVVGALLIALLLVLLLRDMRAALISFIDIPLALLTTLIAIRLAGWTVNMMTLGGLVVALGLIADDAVIDVENIIARLRDAERQHASRSSAILLASLEVRAPVIHATLIIILALLPVVLLNGTAGALLAPLAVTVIIACLAAILIALTATPALSLLFLNHLKPQPHPAWLQAVKDRYRRSLDRSWASPVPLIIAALIILAISVGLAAFFRVELLPPFHDDYLVADFDMPVSTALAVMRETGVRMTADLERDAAIAAVSMRTGRADFGDRATGIEHGQFDIALKPGLSASDEDAATARIARLLSADRGLHVRVRSRLTARGPADAAGISIRIFGEDLDALDGAARQVAALLRTLPGARNVRNETDALAPVIRVDLNFQRLALYGLSSADVLNTVQTAFEGTNAAQTYSGVRSVDIAVTAEDTVRRDPESVGDLLIRSSQGISAPLKYVANVYLTDGRSRIEHDNGTRRQIVEADPSGDAHHFLRLAARAIAERIRLPSGAYIDYAAAEDVTGARSNLLINALVSAAAVMALLFGLYGDLRACLFILGSTLFAAVGGIIMVALTGGVVSLGAFVGFVALFGISARNAILLLSRTRDFLTHGGKGWSADTVFAAARDRFSPILISAIVIAAGLCPIAFDADRPGQEILGPMVLVIIGGLLTSTLMSLFVSPPLVLWLWRSAEFLPHRTARVAA